MPISNARGITRMHNGTTRRIGLVVLLLTVGHRPASAQTALFEPPAVSDTAMPDVQASFTPARSAWSAPGIQFGGYIAFAALQALDVTSTLTALRRPGAYETNPLYSGAVDSPVKFIALKSATTAATILLMQRFSKNHPKASVLVMAGLNSAYLFVVNSNFQQAAGH
jgi:hypothetical protein